MSSAEAALRAELRRRFKERCLLSAAERRLYGYDATGTAFGVPIAVVQAETVNDIQDCVMSCRRHGAHLVARGAGTGLSGGSVPLRGEVVLSLERMRRAEPPDVLHRRLRVGPGVVNGTLDALLRPHGLFYPPDPASYKVSTIGGNVAENAGGPHAVKYGVTGRRVLALDVVDACGDAGRFAAGPWQAGADLVALLTGAEGTLGVVAGVEVGLEERPCEIATLLLSFSDIRAASDCVSAIVAAGRLPATLEFLDAATIAAVEAWGVARYPEGAGAVLLVEFDGDAADVQAGTAFAEQVGRRHGALGVEVARGDAERDALWLGRRGAYAAVARYGRRVLTQDVSVPRHRLTEMLAAVAEISDRYGLRAVTVGHAGDGNLHPDFAYDPADAEESRRVHGANREILAACVALGGSVTGEHGIGSEKIWGLPEMLGPAELGLMWAVREALDPQGLLGPGKAVPEAPRPEPQAQVPAPGGAPADAAELQAAVLAARGRGERYLPDLSRLRAIDLCLPNMTARVGAGATLVELEEALAGEALAFPLAPLRAGTFAELLHENDYGPEEIAQGTLRAHLLAVTYVTGRGELVRMGRDVVKNVAGYDLWRLLIGARGRLGVPAELTLRLSPRRLSPWWSRLGGLWDYRGAQGLEALFAVPEEGAWRLYARARTCPPGFASDEGAPGVLQGLRRSLASPADLLDLAVPWPALGGVLELLGGPPLLVLPSAGRLLARTDGATACSAARMSGPPGRASYAGREMATVRDPLELLWQERLGRVFDPDGTLGGERP